jgi:hypothetical protein
MLVKYLSIEYPKEKGFYPRLASAPVDLSMYTIMMNPCKRCKANAKLIDVSSMFSKLLYDYIIAQKPLNVKR